MTRRAISIASKTDPRLSNLARHGGGEGYATYTGCFDGKPAFIVDCGTLADFLHEDDSIKDPIDVDVFDTEAERSAFLEALRQADSAR